MRLLRVRLLLLTIAAVLLLPVSLSAQDDSSTEQPELTQPVFVNDDIQFRVPDPWLALENDGQITLVSSQETFESVSETGPVPDGEVFAVVFGGALSLVLDTPPNDPAALAQNVGIQLSGGLELDFNAAETFTTGGYDAALISWTFVEGELSQDAGVIAVNVREAYQVVFWYVSNRADFQESTLLMREITATLQDSAGPEATPEPAPSEELTADDLTQTFTTEDEDLTLLLPETWAISEDEDGLFFGTSEAAVASLTEDGGALPAGAMSVIVVRGQVALGLEITDAPEAIVTTLSEQLIESIDTDAISDVFSFSTEDERPGAFQAWGYTLGETPFSAGVLALQQAEEEYVVFLFTVRSNDAAPYVAALQLIAESAISPRPE